MNNPDPVTKHMSTNLITFTTNVDIRVALSTIVNSKISGAPVVNSQGDLIGIISEKDCIRSVVEGPYNNLPGGNGTVGDFMSSTVTTISSDKTVWDAAYQFATSHFRRFPVVENGKLIGQISRRDVLSAIMKLDPKITVIPASWIGREPQVTLTKQGRHNQHT